MEFDSSMNDSISSQVWSDIEYVLYPVLSFSRNINFHDYLNESVDEIFQAKSDGGLQ